MSRPLFSWRHAVISADCLSPTQRHVLLTIAVHMNDLGGGAYPSIETLSAETGLTCRAVSGALNGAEGAGFIKRTKHGYAGRQWKRNEYRAVWPESSEMHYGVIPRTKSASDTQKRRAQRWVTNAVSTGSLKKEPCLACGAENAEAHHADYDKQDEVFWLCKLHHNRLHFAEKQGGVVAAPPVDEVTNEVRDLVETDDSEVTNDVPKGYEPGSMRSRTSFHEVTNEVPSNSTTNSTGNSTTNSTGEGRASAPPPAREAKPKNGSAKSGKKGKRMVPENWTPDDKLVAWCEKEFPGIDWGGEAAKFRDWSRANDERFKNFDAAFRNWMRNAQRFALRDGKPSTPPKLRYLE